MSRHNRRGVATGTDGRILNRRATEETRSWFRIGSTVKNRVTMETDTEVWIYDEIGMWGVSAQDFARELQEVDSETITLRLNSPGGEVYDGIAIMNALIDHKAKVTVKVDALAASIASVIAMAGDSVVMGSHSEFMIHDASTIAMGNAADIREIADMLDRVSENIAQVYAERAGGKAEDWRALMLAETWFSADEAVAAGLADKVAPKPQKRGEDEDEDEDDDTTEARSPRVVSKWDYSKYDYRYHGRSAAPAPRAGGAPKKAIPDVEEATADPVTDEDEVEACDHVDYREDCQSCEDKKAKAEEEPEQLEDVDNLESFDFKDLFASALGEALVEVDAETEGIDTAVFHEAVRMVAEADVPTPERPAIVSTVPPVLAPVFPADSVPEDPAVAGIDPEVFRAAVALAANNAPAVNVQPDIEHTDTDDSFVIDPTEFYNSLREAINQ
jgi:ATP-dependent protease ClpP protease subunit